MSKNLKIAFVCPSFYPYIGGVETVVLQLAQNMASKGLDITVLTQTDNKNLAREERLDNFTIRRFNKVGFSELKISIELLRYMQKNSGNYDLIHVQNYHAFPALCVALTKKSPIIFSPHYHGAGRTFLTNLLHYPYRYIGKFILSQSDAIICDSVAEAQLIEEHFPNIKEINIIPLGIDVEGVQKASKQKRIQQYILSVGRLENYKHVELIVRSLRFIDNKINLKIVGDGSELQRLKDIVVEFNIINRVYFLNNLSNEDLFRLIKNAEAYITMSSMEAYGLSLLEAVAAKIGIVASDISAHRALVKKFKINNIILADLNTSSKNLADNITIAMRNPSYAKKALPSWKQATAQTLQVYKKILRK